MIPVNGLTNGKLPLFHLTYNLLNPCIWPKINGFQKGIISPKPCNLLIGVLFHVKPGGPSAWLIFPWGPWHASGEDPVFWGEKPPKGRKSHPLPHEKNHQPNRSLGRKVPVTRSNKHGSVPQQGHSLENLTYMCRPGRGFPTFDRAIKNGSLVTGCLGYFLGDEISYFLASWGGFFPYEIRIPK